MNTHIFITPFTGIIELISIYLYQSEKTTLLVIMMYAFCPLFLERLKDEGRRLKENVNFINLFGISI
jgi:hypothetical protein